MSGGLRAALRIARRSAMRHRARSALIVVMIALPVLALTGADVLARTMQLSPAEKLARSMGRADAQLTLVGGQVVQTVNGGGWSSEGDGALPGTPGYTRAENEIHRLLPGARTIDNIETGGPIGVHGRLAEGIQIQGLDLRDPVTTGMVRLVRGRVAATTSEVALTTTLAKRLHVGVDDDVTVADAPLRVVGIVRNPQQVRADEAFLLPAAVPAHASTGMLFELVTTTRPVTWSDVQRLNKVGVVVTSRYVIRHPPKGVQLNDSSVLAGKARSIGVATVAVGLAVLEVVLLAGAAFAVGARRQRHDLALVAATGGDERDVRRVVLAGGLVLGAVGALIGVVLGIAGGHATLPLAMLLADTDPGRFDVRPLELLAIAVIGVATAVVAAIVPARAAARDDVVAALTGRRGIVATARKVPVVGLLMIVGGAAAAAYAAHPPARFTLVLVGAVVAELGFVVSAPALVGAAGKLARALPLTMRLALRDASRHRGRTGPAVAAVLAAVAGSVAVSTWITSQLAQDRSSYLPQLRVGQSAVQVTPASKHTVDAATLQASIRRDLPVTGVTALNTTGCPADGECTITYIKPPIECQPGRSCALDIGSGSLAVGDANVLAAVLGRVDSAAAAALERGQVVVFSPRLASNGSATLAFETIGGPGNAEGSSRQATVPAYVVDVGKRGAAVNGIMSTATASRVGATARPWGYLLTTTHRPTQTEQDAAQADLAKWNGSVIVERGYHAERWNYGLLALAGAAAVVTLGATAVSTALSAADSRPDLVTLAAVGAAPHLRRRFAATQAATVAILGTLLGALAGLIPAWAVIHAHGRMLFALPWQTLGIVVVGVPLLAAVATAVLTGSRLPSERRSA